MIVVLVKKRRKKKKNKSSAIPAFVIVSPLARLCRSPFCEGRKPSRKSSSLGKENMNIKICTKIWQQ